MCLKRQTKFKVRLNKEGEGIGHKVFRKGKGGLCGDFCGRNKVRPTNKWLHEKDFRPKPKEPREWQTIKGYAHGWHIFTTKVGARAWKLINLMHVANFQIAKVKFRNVITMGEGGTRNHNVIVAKEIFILEDNA